MELLPFNKPVSLRNHNEIMQQVISCGHLSAGGLYNRLVAQELSKRMGTPTILTSSATHALEMMAILLEIKPGDEVILPSFTFVSTANAFVLRGAIPRFCDNDRYGNISKDDVEMLVTSKTRAVIAVHYCGTSAHLEELRDFCYSKNIILLEDAAQGIGAKFSGKPLGTFGSLACISFHDSKIITSGEGGALIISDEQYIERAMVIRDKGTNRSEFLLGHAHYYAWLDQGSSYGMSDLNAGYLYPQLLELDQIIERRKGLWFRYLFALETPLLGKDIQILKCPELNQPNYQQMSLLFCNEKQRAHYISFMKKCGITVSFHYIPLHLSPYGRQWHDPKHALPYAEWISSVIVRLPIYFNLTDGEQDKVILSTLEWINQSQIYFNY